ncbi:MAG: hypothetical protein HC905_04245 [Bacteroidales bacterium]|nr:hypothetical protein [Bacteroidales bacterium]
MSYRNQVSRRGFLKFSSMSGLSLMAWPSQSLKEPTSYNLHPDILKPGTSLLNPIPFPIDLTPAKWIWYPCGRTLQNTVILFRKEIHISGEIAEATGYILADSRYLLTVNGKRIQWGPAPHDPRSPEADPLDLKASLRQGRNIIASKVLFYGTGDGTWPIGNPVYYKLDIKYTNGTSETVISDDSWNCLLARSWKPGQFKRWFLRAFQEEFDARLYPYGWEDVQFETDKTWQKAFIYGKNGSVPVVCTGSPEYQWEIWGDAKTCSIHKRSIPMMTETVEQGFKLIESAWIEWDVPPEEYFESVTKNAFRFNWANVSEQTGSGEWTIPVNGNKAASVTFALHEQMVGWPMFSINAPEGTIVEILVHEAHKPGSQVMLNTHFHSWSRFICKEGLNQFETFDFESYRWIQFHIRNYNRPVILSNIAIRRRVFPWKKLPEIHCSEPALQRLFEASVNTLNNSAQETVVDGMARERQQYSGDGAHQLHAIYHGFGETRLSARFINTFSMGLTHEGYFWIAGLHSTGWPV